MIILGLQARTRNARAFDRSWKSGPSHPRICVVSAKLTDLVGFSVLVVNTDAQIVLVLIADDGKLGVVSCRELSCEFTIIPFPGSPTTIAALENRELLEYVSSTKTKISYLNDFIIIV